jgi:hypothetical protein
MSRLHLDARGAGLAFDGAGNRLGSVLLDSADGDAFWAGGGNDRIFGNGDRDCAVWGAENWGRDTVAATSGTMALVFSDLADACPGEGREAGRLAGRRTGNHVGSSLLRLPVSVRLTFPAGRRT